MPSNTRSRTWTRIRLHIFHDARSVNLDATATYLRLVTALHAIEDAGQRVGGSPAPDAAWLVTDTGAPFTARTLAHLSRLTEPEVLKALKDLEHAELLVRSDAGAWGVADISAVTESPSAERLRLSRVRRRQAEEAGEPTKPRTRQAGHLHISPPETTAT